MVHWEPSRTGSHLPPSCTRGNLASWTVIYLSFPERSQPRVLDPTSIACSGDMVATRQRCIPSIETADSAAAASHRIRTASTESEELCHRAHRLSPQDYCVATNTTQTVTHAIAQQGNHESVHRWTPQLCRHVLDTMNEARGTSLHRTPSQEKVLQQLNINCQQLILKLLVYEN